VEKVLKGRGRVESDRFTALRSHYGFDSFFCLPGIKGAHEKGGVEGEIGRFRRRFMVPVPKVSSMAELNEVLMAAVEKDDLRHIAGRRPAWPSISPWKPSSWRHCRPRISPTRP